MAPLLLISDDDSAFVSTVRRQAVRQGLRVVTDMMCEAPNMARVHQPDLILLDVVQPVSGLELLRQVKAHPSTSKATVVMMSGISDTHTQQRCLEAGAEAFLLKPHIEELDAVLSRLAAGQRVVQDAAAKRGSILLVDENPQVLQVAGRALEEAGFKVFTLDNPFLIGPVVRRRRPDLVLVDMDLPGLKGKQALELVSTSLASYAIPVYIHSSGNEEALTRARTQMQAAGVLRRTSEPRELVRQLLESLDGRKALP